MTSTLGLRMRASAAKAVALALAALAIACIAAIVSPALAAAQGTRVRVRVVEVAGGRAYLEPGSDQGIRRGGLVVIDRRRFRVLATTSKYAVIDVRNQPLAEGAQGIASARPDRAEEAGDRLPAPTPLAQFEGVWPEPTVPAEQQEPRFVPIGVVADDSASPVHVLFNVGAAAIVPLGGDDDERDGGPGALARGELRARVHATPFRELPFAIDADVAVRAWLASDIENRDGSDSRPLLWVRQLQLSMGEERELFAALGRLRYAASTIGMLDGARVSTPILKGFTLGAFGGFVPNPLDGRPAIEATRFGVELGYHDDSSDWRPQVSVVGHGSTFEGSLDERRISAEAMIFPGNSRISGHVEVSAFDLDNAWAARSLELTAAGVDASFRFGALDIGGRVDMRRPERSLWLEAYLPRSFLCTATPQRDPTVPEECAFLDDTRYLAQATAGLTLERLAISGGATAIRTGHLDDFDQLGGFGQVRVLDVFEKGRADVTVMGSTGAFLDTIGVRLGAGMSLLRDKVDVSAHYRPSLNYYEADVDGWVEHMIGADVVLSPITELDVSVGADTILGRDVNVLLVQTFATWRPL